MNYCDHCGKNDSRVYYDGVRDIHLCNCCEKGDFL